MKWYKPLLIFLLCWSVTVQAQEVWPGDVNNNGVVNGVDVLYLGLAYGSNGPLRAGGNNNWEAQTITTLWGSNFSSGLNYAYADCNGDGVINEDDLDEVIKENFGLTHGIPQADGFTNGIEGIDPALILEPERTVTEWGTMLNIDLRLGTETIPASNFYGLAIKMSYNAEVLNKTAEEEGFDFDLGENTWIEGSSDDPVEYFFSKDHNTGKAELAITRTDQNFISEGSGSIGQFSVVVEDIIVGAGSDTFTIHIDSVFYLDDQMNIYPIVPDTTMIVIRDSASSVTGTAEWFSQDVKVYPNPAKEYFIIETENYPEKIKVYNAMGIPMPVFVKPHAYDKTKLNTNGWPAGIYYLELRIYGQAIIKKLLIVPDGG